MAKITFEIAYRTVPFTKGRSAGSIKRIEKDDIQKFWDNDSAKPLADGIGCYVFGSRAGKGFKPWYVGQSTGAFKRECFASDKRNKYNGILFKGKKGTPVMFFITVVRRKGPVPKKKIDELETFLIQTARIKNPELINIAKTKDKHDWGIKGIVNAGKGKPSKPAQDFKQMMKL
jgi:hypothetical protein